MQIDHSRAPLTLAFVLTAACLPGWAQSDAQNFAEGRVALDKYKDCKASLDALGGVSEDGRKDPVWVFYMAKANECMNRAADALRYYEEYDRLLPGQAPVLDKIGDLRYRVGVERRQEEAGRARQQQAEENVRALAREKQDAKARLAAVLQNLSHELLRNSQWVDEDQTRWSVSPVASQSCSFRLTVIWEEPSRMFDAGTRNQYVVVKSQTQHVVLDLAEVTTSYVDRLLPGYPLRIRLYGDRNAKVVSGSFEIVDKIVARDKGSSRDRGRSGSLPDTERAEDGHDFTLPLDPSQSKESWGPLKLAFDAAVATCKKAAE
jgi:hypothetical protein